MQSISTTPGTKPLGTRRQEHTASEPRGLRSGIAARRLMKTFTRRPVIAVADARGWRGRQPTMKDSGAEDVAVMHLHREAA
jgi:hypothetical protein